MTEGRSFVDKRTPALARKARAAGFKVGWYHFANSWDQTPVVQADHFLSVLKTVGEYDLIPCLDMEQGAPSTQKGSWAKSFIREVEYRTGDAVAVYGSTYYLSKCFSFAAKCPGPLWIAGVREDGGPLDYRLVRIPKPWTDKDVASHQYNWHGRVPGIPGEVDVSRPIHVSLFNRASV